MTNFASLQNLPSALDAAVRAVCPNANGVRLADITDRSTWTATFADGYVPSKAEQAAVTSAIAAFVYVPVAPRDLAAEIDALKASVALKGRA